VLENTRKVGNNPLPISAFIGMMSHLLFEGRGH